VKLHSRITIKAADFIVVYVIAMHALMFANLFLTGRSLTSPLFLPFAFVTLLLAFRFYLQVLRRPVPSLSPLDLAVTVYLAVSLCSLVSFLTPGNPAAARAYLYGLNLQVLPMLMYFAAKGLDATDVSRVLRVLIGMQAFCALVGIPLFLVRPDFYTAFLADRLGYSEDWQNYARLQSYMGSTAVGILSAVAIVLLANVRMSGLLRYSLALLFALTIFLAQQRGAYVSGVIAFAFLLYRSKLSALQFTAAVGGTIVAVFVGLNSLGLDTDLLAGIFSNRIVDDLFMGDPLGERRASYGKGLSFLTEHPFGLGLGATTSAAQDSGAHVNGQVVDAYYMRVASDLGVQGLVLFLVVLAVAALQSLCHSVILGIAVLVAIYSLQSIGTNVLDTFFVSHAFWLLLGLSGTEARGATYGPKGARPMHFVAAHGGVASAGHPATGLPGAGESDGT
jgi:hypothetical protein